MTVDTRQSVGHLRAATDCLMVFIVVGDAQSGGSLATSGVAGIACLRGHCWSFTSGSVHDRARSGGCGASDGDGTGFACLRATGSKNADDDERYSRRPITR